ncbi:MAG: hypothetical protein PHT69_16580, partial [Bacteroidales bacterium]|nr:hypothetical protein [Bacteroidales bacterium]
MRKINYLLVLILIVISINVRGQNITAAEYFFNTDPGIGNGTPFTITPGTDITKSLTIPTSGLLPGFNHLYIRVKNSSGIWSLYANSTIYIKPSQVPVKQLVSGEYFFNTDPGVGNGTPFTFAVGDSVNLTFSAITSGLQPGFNYLFVRIKDLDGKWGLYADRTLYVKPVPKISTPLNYAEYFFDTDPGIGNGVPVLLPPAEDDKTLNMQIPTTGLQPGAHRIYFRFRDTTFVFGLHARMNFQLCDIAALANFTADTVCLGQDSTFFTNLSTGGDVNTVYRWDFNGDGVNDVTHTGIIGGTAPYQFFYKYQTGGVFNARLVTDNGGGCSDTLIKQVVVKVYPPVPTPTGTNALCINNPNTIYKIPIVPGATSYYWQFSPSIAGSFTMLADTAIEVNWNNTYVGQATIIAGATYGPCDSTSSAPTSAPLTVTLSPLSVGGQISVINSSICFGSSTGSMTLSGYTGQIVRWQKKLGANNWMNINHTTAIYSETPTNVGVWQYRALLKNGGCDTVYSTAATITVNPQPAAADTIVGSIKVCQGQQLVSYSIPTISGATNYTWNLWGGASINSGQGTNSILVNFSPQATSGTITVFGSNSCGQGASSPILDVTVNQAPLVNVTPYPDTSILFGNFTPLAGSASMGNPPYTYQWTPSSLVSTPTNQNTNTVALQNTTTFTLTVTDSLGCPGHNSTNVIVTGIPLTAFAISNPPYICAGENSILTAIYTGGDPPYSFQWSSNPGTFTSNAQSPMVSPTVTTQYTVTVTGGGQTTSASTTVNISPKPSAAGNISGLASVCQGQNGVTYSVPTVSGANGYVWNLPSGATIASGANTNTIVVNFASNASSGNISVAGSNNCGSGVFSSPFAVNVNQLPIVSAGNDTSISNGANIILNGSALGGSGFYSFSWSPASLLVNPNVQNPQTVNLTNSTNFTLTVTDNITGCMKTAQVQILVLGYPLSVTPNATPPQICQSTST